MIYKPEDVNFSQLTSTEFERLCQEFLFKLGFKELIWRQGGPDNGRDIEASLIWSNPLSDQKTKWYFECKHYEGGVPPVELNSKIAWADAGRPQYLVILVSSYITTGARTWLGEIKSQKLYNILVIEGEELKRRIIQFPDLVERFFSSNRFETLLKDIRKHHITFRIMPSYEVLRELLKNIDPEKLTLSEAAFLLQTFYCQYNSFSEDEYISFDPDLPACLFNRLSTFASPRLDELEPYQDHTNLLGGNGFADEYEYFEYGSETRQNYSHQFYELHLNYDREGTLWKLGWYLFVRDVTNNRAFELFTVVDSDYTSSVKLHTPYDPTLLANLAFEGIANENLLDFLKHFPNMK